MEKPKTQEPWQVVQQAAKPVKHACACPADGLRTEMCVARCNGVSYKVNWNLPQCTVCVWGKPDDY